MPTIEEKILEECKVAFHRGWFNHESYRIPIAPGVYIIGHAGFPRISVDVPSATRGLYSKCQIGANPIGEPGYGTELHRHWDTPERASAYLIRKYAQWVADNAEPR